MVRENCISLAVPGIARHLPIAMVVHRLPGRSYRSLVWAVLQIACLSPACCEWAVSQIAGLSLTCCEWAVSQIACLGGLTDRLSTTYLL